VIGAGGELLAVKVVGRNMHKYSSSTTANLCVAPTNRLSPMIGRGLANGKGCRAVEGLATR